VRTRDAPEPDGQLQRGLNARLPGTAREAQVDFDALTDADHLLPAGDLVSVVVPAFDEA